MRVIKVHGNILQRMNNDSFSLDRLKNPTVIDDTIDEIYAMG